MKFSNLSVLSLLSFLSLGLTSLTITTAAPQPEPRAVKSAKAKPASPPPPPAGAAPDACRLCLAKELRDIPKCDRLTPTTPALPSSEKDPVKIQAYKTKFPDVVDCLCLGAEWIEKPKAWIAKCDDFCTVTAAQKQIKVFKDFEVQLGCRSRGGGVGKSDESQKAPAPDKAPVATSTPAPSAKALADVPGTSTAKPKDIANKPKSKPAAVVKDTVVTSNPSAPETGN